METKKISFCYKGRRNYIHGTDIFNKVLEAIYESSGKKRLGDFEMTIRKISTKNMDLYWESKAGPEIINSNVVFSLNDGAGDIRLVLVEGDNLVECRHPYPENNIIDAGVFDGDSQAIELRSFNQFSLIEKIVALNKELLRRLFPEANGKWYFTRIKLSTIDMTLWVSGTADILLKFKKNMQFKITDTIIYIDDIQIGHIYFSLVNGKN